MKDIRWRSRHPSRCLDQDTNVTFNSVSASTSYQSVRGSAAHVACPSECMYTRQKEGRDKDTETETGSLSTANTHGSNIYLKLPSSCFLKVNFNNFACLALEFNVVKLWGNSIEKSDNPSS